MKTNRKALLFTAFALAAQPRLNADQLQASLQPGNLLRVSDVPRPSEPAVTICLVTDPNRLIVGAAETLTNQMFVAIRVVLRWHEPPVCPAKAGHTIFLMLQTGTPESQFPGALGVAHPREGSHAWVFYDRIQRAGRDDTGLTALLAHAMAHEIAHLLQGINRHSESGILKAHWSGTDCARMAHFPLMFTREDAILIHRGLEERQVRMISSRRGGAPSNRSEEIWALRERSLLVP